MNKKAIAESFMTIVQEAAKTMPPHPSKLDRKDLFLRFVDLKKKAHAKERAIAALGLDPYAFNEEYCGAIVSLLHLAFTPMQVETIEWWLYEDVKKVIYWPDEGKEWNVEQPEQLFEYITTQQSI